ncbi:MAG: hypothetical protein QG592_852 [Pseudomonadota bacterium]|nr:hypothetical protein [Pseudomonadota bacterium]
MAPSSQGLCRGCPSGRDGDQGELYPPSYTPTRSPALVTRHEERQRGDGMGESYRLGGVRGTEAADPAQEHDEDFGLAGLSDVERAAKGGGHDRTNH